MVTVVKLASSKVKSLWITGQKTTLKKKRTYWPIAEVYARQTATAATAGEATNSRQFGECHTISLTEPLTAPRVLTNQ